MANYIEKTNIKSSKFTNNTSRYNDINLIYYTEKNFLTYPLYKKNKYSKNNKEKYALITKKYEYRPDLVSYKFYGTPDFWWKIMEANNIKDIFDFKTGLSIKLPGNIL